jgi:hypothetical protein
MVSFHETSPLTPLSAGIAVAAVVLVVAGIAAAVRISRRPHSSSTIEILSQPSLASLLPGRLTLQLSATSFDLPVTATQNTLGRPGAGSVNLVDPHHEVAMESDMTF